MMGLPMSDDPVPLSRDRKLWLLTAHSDTWRFSDAPVWLSAECERLGLVVATAGAWKLTERGHRAWRELRGPY